MALKTPKIPKSKDCSAEVRSGKKSGVRKGLLYSLIPIGILLLLLLGFLFIPAFSPFGTNNECDPELYIEVDEDFYITSYINNGFLLDEENSSFYIGNIVFQTIRIDTVLYEYLLENDDWNETINETDFMSLTGYGLYVFGHSSGFPDTFVASSNISLDGLNGTFGFPLVTLITSIIIDVYYENGTLLESDPFIVIEDETELLTNMTIMQNQTFLFDECSDSIELKFLGARYNATADEMDECYVEIDGVATVLDRGYGYFSP